MKITTLTLLSLLFLFPLYGQTPQLVVDFNSGEEDAFNRFNFEGIELNDLLIFPIQNSESGEEIGILNNGELSLLKDINEGTASSQPNNFTLFNGKVYFSAFSESAGGAIWSTDGTEENTIIEFSFNPNSNLRPRGLITSLSGWLYYTYDRMLYRTDGTVNESLFNGVNFVTEQEQQSNNYNTYQDEVAFLAEENNVLKLFTISDGSVVELAEVGAPSNFADIFGLSEVSEGIIFGVDDSFNDDIEGTYSYNSTTTTLEKITIADRDARRLHKFTNDASLAWVSGEGYYLSNGVQNEEVLLYSSNNTSFTNGDEVPLGTFENNMVFQVDEGGFGDQFIYYTDGTTSGTNELFEVSKHISNILVHESFAFIVDGTSNGFDPKMYYINMYDQSVSNFYNFSQSSSAIESILLLGVQNNRLYFLSNLDETVGREMYSIALDIDTNTEEIERSVLDVQFHSNGYRVELNEFLPLNVSTYTIDGKLISSNTIFTNTDYRLPNKVNGLYVMRFQLGEKTASYKVIGNRR